MFTFYTLRLQASIDSIVFVYSGENDVQLAGVPRSRGVLSPQLQTPGLIVNSFDKLGLKRLMNSPAEIFN